MGFRPTDPHIDPDPRNDRAAGPARDTQIRSRMLLAMSLDDDRMPEKIFSNTKALANEMTMVQGTTLLVEHTGHSIPTERPVFFAGQILDFLFGPAEVGRFDVRYTAAWQPSTEDEIQVYGGTYSEAAEVSGAVCDIDPHWRIRRREDQLWLTSAPERPTDVIGRRDRPDQGGVSCLGCSAY
jgi:hypothetical protein